MRKTTALIAMIVLAASAGARNVGLRFTADRTEAGIGDTVTWTVSAWFTGFSNATAYFGGFSGSFDATLPGSAEIVNFENLMGLMPPPTLNGASFDEISILNHALHGTNDPSNPIDIFTFEAVVLSASSDGDWSYDAAGVATMFPDDGIFTIPVDFNSFPVSSDRVTIPAPCVAVMLCGAVAIRRRR